MSALRDAFG
ncbi:unnamed protein product, partial [Didymodactylos carnosus]